jgi:prophage DNA circulation protein
LRAIRRATRHIQELSVTLDRQLGADTRPEEQMRHLRHATGQITRAANDAVQAYRRVSGALKAEAAHPDVDAEELEHARQELAKARAAMLEVLKSAGDRYPGAEPFGPTG